MIDVFWTEPTRFRFPTKIHGLHAKPKRIDGRLVSVRYKYGVVCPYCECGVIGLFAIGASFIDSTREAEANFARWIEEAATNRLNTHFREDCETYQWLEAHPPRILGVS